MPNLGRTFVKVSCCSNSADSHLTLYDRVQMRVGDQATILRRAISKKKAYPVLHGKKCIIWQRQDVQLWQEVWVAEELLILWQNGCG